MYNVFRAYSARSSDTETAEKFGHRWLGKNIVTDVYTNCGRLPEK